MGEGLVIDPQFEHISMLHDVEHVRSDLKGVLKGGPELLDLTEQFAIPVNFLLAAEMTAHELNRYQS